MAAELGKCVTPASPSAVSTWLESAAHASLAARAALVTAIESGTATVPEPDIASRVAVRLKEPRAVSPVSAPPHATQASSISTVSDVLSGTRRSPRRWRIVASLGVGGVIAVITVAGLALHRSSGAPPPTAASAIAGGPPVAIASDDGPQAAPAADASTLADASFAASAASVPAVSPVARPQVHVQKHPAKHPPYCDPPYTWDAQGKKHYKAECL
jgi:hypothetical protein